MIAAFAQCETSSRRFRFVSFSFCRNSFGRFVSFFNNFSSVVFPLAHSSALSLSHAVFGRVSGILLGSNLKWTLIAVIIAIVNVNVMRAVFTFDPIRNRKYTMHIDPKPSQLYIVFLLALLSNQLILLLLCFSTFFFYINFFLVVVCVGKVLLENSMQHIISLFYLDSWCRRHNCW